MTNCLFYALGRCWRDGGYLIIRKSRHGSWPHFIWSKDLKTFYQYGPLVPRIGMWFPPIIFEGSVTSFTEEIL